MMERGADYNWERQERQMAERLWNYIYRASTVCALANAIIIWSIHKYSHHPHPTIASIQLLSPLLLWEVLLVMSFCPADIIEFYLEELLIEDGIHNLNMEVLAHLRRGNRRRLRVVHSAGDVMNSDRTANTSMVANRPSETTQTPGITESNTVASTRSFHSIRGLND